MKWNFEDRPRMCHEAEAAAHLASNNQIRLSALPPKPQENLSRKSSRLQRTPVLIANIVCKSTPQCSNLRPFACFDVTFEEKII